MAAPSAHGCACSGFRKDVPRSLLHQILLMTFEIENLETF